MTTKKAYLAIAACLLMIGSAAKGDQSQVTEAFINAPIADVWRIFTTAEGYRTTGAAHAQVDLKIGGEIRAHYDPEGELGDAETIVHEILAYEPQRMLALRVKRAPASFPHRDLVASVWTVLYFTPSGEAMTHVRIVGLGYGEDPQSQAMRKYFETGNRWTLDHIAKQYWPQCARCAAEEVAETP